MIDNVKENLFIHHMLNTILSYNSLQSDDLSEKKQQGDYFDFRKGATVFESFFKTQYDWICNRETDQM